jgi:hypothetical protein
MRLAKNHKFGSSGLNLVFEGQRLGASILLCVKGTCSDPRMLGFRIHDTLVYSKVVLVEFCRKSEVPEVFDRKHRMTDEMKACGTAAAEATSRRHRAGDQARVAASMCAHGGIRSVKSDPVI